MATTASRFGGVYDVSVVVDGQVKDLVKGVRTKGDPTETDFNLKNAQAAGAAGAPPTEAERNMTPAQKAEFEKANKAREAQLAARKELNDAYSAGKTALDAKMYDEAIEAFTKAAALDDKQVAIWSGLADAYVGFGGAETGGSFRALRKGLRRLPEGDRA